MKQIAKIFGTIFISLLALINVSAQDKDPNSEKVRIQTVDGNYYLGKVILKNDSLIILETNSLGIIEIKKINILKIHEIQGKDLEEGRYDKKTTFVTRYFMGPSGYGLDPGQGYYQNGWIFFNHAAIGITKNISIGVGTIPLFLFAGTSTPVWITPKISIPIVKDAINVGIGTFMGRVIGESEMGFGIGYIVTTFGNRDYNLSLGFGSDLTNGEKFSPDVLTVSAMLRTGPHGYFISENMFMRNGIQFASFGGRTLFGKISLDYGLIIPLDSETLFAIPWLGFSIPFGN